MCLYLIVVLPLFDHNMVFDETPPLQKCKAVTLMTIFCSALSDVLVHTMPPALLPAPWLCVNCN